MRPLATLCVALAIAIGSAGCSHFFEGTVAELDDAPDLKIVTTAFRYGDCFRLSSKVPVLYQIARPGYSLQIALGDRYWPGLLLAARDRHGNGLGLAGDHIVEVRLSGDIRRLNGERGTELTHAVRMDIPIGWNSGTDSTVQAVREGRITPKTVSVEVRSTDGTRLGGETFTYRVRTIHCLEFDGP